MTVSTQQFSLVIGGPLHALLSRLRLVGADRLPTFSAALVLVAIAWVPPAMLALLEFLYNGNASALSYFRDYVIYIRDSLAIGFMVVTERSAHLRLTPVIDQFIAARLVTGDSLARFMAAPKSADDRSSSALAEAALLVAVTAFAAFGAPLELEYGVFDWDGRLVDGEPVYTLAGLRSHFISRTRFHFLVLRWLWRFGVWGLLLFRVSRAPLSLLAYHPDRSGGLGFLSIYPMVFSGLIFALSSVIAAQLVSEIQNGVMSVEVQRAMMVAWMILVLVLFVLPLAFFVQPLFRLREQSIFELGRVASEHHSAFERKWLSNEASGAGLLGSADVSSASDIAPIASSPYSLRILPVSFPMTLQLALTAGVPMLVVLAMQMPLDQFLGFILATLL